MNATDPRPRRVWLVGEHNPLSADPRHALYPRPPGCAGARLAKVLGLSEEAYLSAFERRNLLPHDAPRWSAALARDAAKALLGETSTGDRLVLLGARVAAAFGLLFRESLFRPAVRPVGLAGAPRAVLVLPHPSGRSREWNAPDAAPKAREGLRELLEVA